VVVGSRSFQDHLLEERVVQVGQLQELDVRGISEDPFHDRQDAQDQEVFTDGGVSLASPEYLNVGTNDTLLEDVRKATGGKIAKTDEVFRRAELAMPQFHQFDYLLLTLATVLFALDILVRRLPALVQLFARKGPA
jgi:hypothetical protein